MVEIVVRMSEMTWECWRSHDNSHVLWENIFSKIVEEVAVLWMGWLKVFCVQAMKKLKVVFIA